MKKHQSIR